MAFVKNILAITIAGMGVTCFAAQPTASTKASSSDLAIIASTMGSKGYAPVVVSFNVDSSLQALAANAGGIANKAKQMEQKLVSSLGKNVIQSTIYRNGTGQTELYVNQAALAVLDSDPNVVGYWFNTLADTHRTTGTPDEIGDIEAEILKKGYADVEAVLNIDHYDLGEANSTQTNAWREAQVQDVQKTLPTLLASLPLGASALSASSNASNASTPSAIQQVRITREELYSLQNSSLIRNLRLAGSSTGKVLQPVSIDPTALQDAQKNGSVTLMVVLRPTANYSPFVAKLPATALQTQTKIIKSAFYDIFGSYTNSELLSLKEYPGFNFVSVRLTAQGVKRLAGNLSPAIAAASVARSATLISTYAPKAPNMPVTGSGGTAALLGAPLAWALSNADGSKVDGHNITIAVVDTGVHKSHEAFNDGTPQGRVKFEGCFGTNDGGNYVSHCISDHPPALSPTGDSPFGQPNSGLPVYSAATNGRFQFDHGTKVAGIAAGVAPKATLASISVATNTFFGTSIDEKPDDIIQALQAIYTLSQSYGSNIVTNVSLNLMENCSDTSNAMYIATKTVIDNLVNASRIPVVVGSGNQNGSTNVTLPACLPNVISVAGTYAGIPPGYPSNHTYYWEGSTYNSGVLFAAPAAYVVAPSISRDGNSTINNFYNGEDAGTSFSTPHVSALYALAKSADAFKNSPVSDITNWFLAGVGTMWTKTGTNTYTCSPKAIRVAASANIGNPCSNRVF